MDVMRTWSIGLCYTLDAFRTAGGQLDMVKGGRRQGAGRPFIAPESKKVQMTITITPGTRDWMRQMAAEQGLTTGEILDLLIESYEDLLKENI